MALERTGEDLLTAAQALGADFSSSVMIGRQNHGGPGQYAEPFFRSLGAEEISSIDASDFESATHIHDMNDPIPSSLKSRFGMVFDGGTLEHVFNYAQALKNCMEMVRLGGFFVQVAPGNNFMGHGFWQTSPELLYRVFSAENGFETKGVFVHDMRQWWNSIRYGQYFKALDPAQLGWRVELANHWPTNVTLIAKLVSEVEPLTKWPQQSDYAVQWDGAAAAARPARHSLKDLVRKLIPAGGERMLRGRFANKAYVPISRGDVRAGKF